MKKSNVFKPAAVAMIFGMTAFTAYASDAPTSMNQDSVSLLQAVEIAKNNTNAVPMEAERDVEMGQAIYEIELIGKNGEEIHTVVNATTGEVILTQQRRDHDDDHHDDDDQVENALWLSGVNNGKYLSLETAVKQAEAEFGGKAWSVEMDDDHNSLTYEIEMLNANGKRVETKIDAVNPAKS
ncbi:PepSY domain-containing protein [Enterovibrio sp. ZSDZ35]|uniref:PepSY domain-containing protein n=1 Tax=Enterovibrio qingdaonensis TaxID=2899818 RepID=A0ABT5QTP5_9GAMM|nr:PepSY domain-containing protein [Enterovibrio sp. ZSDZ35]MDD1784279.1 PepSY domain-containing protein [Enterovibrio sp. ZSDZ35]